MALTIDEIGDIGSASISIPKQTNKSMDAPIFNPYSAPIPFKPVNANNGAKYAYNYFQKRGIPKHVAAGLVGNLQQESGVRPLTYDDGANGAGGGGVAQWSPVRYKGLQRYAKQSGKDSNKLDTQLDYILHELDTTESKARNKIFATNNAADSAQAFQDFYFRPNKRMANTERRVGVANSLAQFKYGGKFATGGFNLSADAGGAIGAGLGLIGSAIDATQTSNPNKKKTVGASVLKSAGSGAALGSTILPGWGTAIGAAVGAVGGLIGGGAKARREQKQFDKVRMLAQQDFNATQQNRSNLMYSQANPYQYKYGGKHNFVPEFEVEKDEIMRGEFALSDGKKLSKNIYKVGGVRHGEVNPTTGAMGVWGAGQGTIYSNSLFVNGKSIAKHAEGLAKQVAKFEPQVNSSNAIVKATAERNLHLLNNDLDNLFEHQESLKKFKFGGIVLAKFADGGEVAKKRKAIEDRIRTLDTYLKQNTTRQALGKSDPKDALRKEKAQLEAQLNNKTIWNDKPWNPLDSATNLTAKDKIPFMTKDGGSLNEVVIKGKRTTPTVTSPKSATNAKTSAVSEPVSTRKSIPAVLPQGFDASIRADNRFGNLRAGSKIGTVDTVTPNGTNSIENAGQVRNRFRGKVDWNNLAKVGMMGADYLTRLGALNKMKTTVPINLSMNDYYGYRDNSRLARHNVTGLARTLFNNPNLSVGQKQQTFARAANTINEINAQENEVRTRYDDNFANNQFRINAQNNAVLNDRNMQTVAAENAITQERANAFGDLLGNVNMLMAENQQRKLDEQRLGVVQNAYRMRYGKQFVTDYSNGI
jgi:hypothetical protein